MVTYPVSKGNLVIPGRVTFPAQIQEITRLNWKRSAECSGFLWLHFPNLGLKTVRIS